MNSTVGSGLRHFPGLGHEGTLELMRRADYLLLPTLHDTFGYVSLEAMSRGTPSIATSTCAQNEIIEHGRSGFLLDFDNDPVVGEWIWLYGQSKPGYVDAYWQAIEKLARELVATLALAWERRKDYEQMSAAAIRRTVESFDRTEARRRLASLYQLALSPRQSVQGGAHNAATPEIPTVPN
jgi:glycosyltransferase involved in cell wall biosynthesis